MKPLKKKTKNMIIAITAVFASMFLIPIPGTAEESLPEEKIETNKELTKEFQAVYHATRIILYRHIPTDQMYICYIGHSIAPMSITYEEYAEKSRAFHAENDTEPESILRTNAPAQSK